MGHSRTRLHLAATALLVPLALAGCAERGYVRTVGPATFDPPPPVVFEPEAMPVPIAPERVTVAGIDTAKALETFSGDVLALRFLLLRRLTETGLAPESEYETRSAANKGALLPLTAEPPAAGLDLPLPPGAEVLARFQQLSTSTKGTIDTRQREREFLLDQLLPAKPLRRTQLHPPDLVTARQLLGRLERLEATGLITPDEHRREAAALDELMASGALPPVYFDPAKVAATPKKKSGGKAGGGGSGAGAGGASGGATAGVGQTGLTRSGNLRIEPLPASASPPPAVADKPAGVHLLSMASAGFAEKAFNALKKEHPELAELSYKAVRADLGNLGITYRLVAGPLEQVAAERLCGALRAKGQACMATTFED